MEPMTTPSDNLIRQRILDLKKQRESIMDLEPQEIQEAILKAPQPAALVHSFPEEDFYFLVHTIGAEDALALLKLASSKQWEYLLDQESWQWDRLDHSRLTRWLYLLLKADPVRFSTWSMQEKPQIIEFYLSRNIEIRIREHDQNPSDFGQGFLTDDDFYYFRLIDYPAVDSDAIWTKEQRDELIRELLSRISARDHVCYQNLLLESTSILPAEIEEEEYRLRSVRLAEKGFLPFDEAIGVYQPLYPDEIGHKGKKCLPKTNPALEFTPVPLFTNRVLPTDNIFARALAKIDDPNLLMLLQSEFASLCNQIISADQKRIEERKDLIAVVTKTSGYLSIGLEVLSQSPHLKPPADFGTYLRKYLLSEIFRVGFGKALHLKWRAERWRRESWFQSAGLPLTFWGEAWLGVLGGLLVQKPLYFDNYKSGELYREFGDLDEIQKTAATLDEIISLDLIFSLMEIQIEDIKIKRNLSHKSLLLTLWADHLTGLEPKAKRPVPIPLADFRPFFQELWDPERPGHINETIKAIFLDWLAGRSGLTVEELSRKISHILTDLFEEIEAEMGAVSPNHLDPRFIPLFWVR